MKYQIYLPKYDRAWIIPCSVVICFCDEHPVGSLPIISMHLSEQTGNTMIHNTPILTGPIIVACQWNTEKAKDTD